MKGQAAPAFLHHAMHASAAAPEPTDQALVAAALLDGDAYAPLVERYEAPLTRYLYRLGCRSKSDADDILQEVFIKAYRNLNGYDATMKFSSWIYRIAHNETMTFFRKSSRAPRVARDDDELVAFDELPDGTSIAAELDAELDAAVVRDAVSRLDPKYRDVLVLRFLEDRSYEEISDILRKPPGTVATLISRAKVRLRAILASTPLHP